jgi:hypothetical protein
MALYLESKSCQFEYKLKREDGRENHIQNVQRLGIIFWLMVKFHRQRDCVYHDQYENCVLKRLRRHEPPHFILYPVFWNVSSYWFCFQRKLYAVALENKI